MLRYNSITIKVYGQKKPGWEKEEEEEEEEEEEGGGVVLVLA